MSDFCPDTRGWWWTLVLGSLVQSHCGEEGTPQTHNTGVYSQCLSHTGPAPARGTHSSGSRLLHQEPSEAGPGLHAPPRSKQVQALRKSSEVRTWLGLRSVPFPGPSSSGDEVFGKCGHCDLFSPPSLPLGFLGVQPVHLLRQMLTVQNPRKS